MGVCVEEWLNYDLRDGGVGKNEGTGVGGSEEREGGKGERGCKEWKDKVRKVT